MPPSDNNQFARDGAPDPADRPDGVTWAVLLARWTDFAKAGLALPKGAEGDRWRRSIPPIIGLQAVTFAIADADRLAAADRPGAADRAELVIRRHESELREAWRPDEPPAGALEIVADARAALEAERRRAAGN